MLYCDSTDRSRISFFLLSLGQPFVMIWMIACILLFVIILDDEFLNTNKIIKI